MVGSPEPAEVPKQLTELEEAERSISARRLRLHDRIDFLRGGGTADAGSSAETLELLLEKEKQLSAERLALHDRINELRAAAGLPSFKAPTSRGLDQA